MTGKFTLRDFLVYSFVGLTGGLLFYHHNPGITKSLLDDLSTHSGILVIIIIPIFYFIGHIVMGVDDIIFNYLLYMPLRNIKQNNTKRFWKFYNFLFFGFRNQGLKRELKIDEETFLKTCDSLIDDDAYEKAEYYQIMSDLFKGILLCLISSTIYRISNNKYNLFEIGLIVVVWYRARIFSSYYVRIIQRKIKL